MTFTDGKPAVFFDRDNTLIADPGYFHDPDAVQFLSGVIPVLKTLNDHGCPIFIVTNQSGVGRGMYPLEIMRAVHDAIRDILSKNGVTPRGIYYCPHRPDENCHCRKPKPYLIHQAAREHGLNLSRSFMVGNDRVDMEFGRLAGVRTIAVFNAELTGSKFVDFNAGSDFGRVGEFILKSAGGGKKSNRRSFE